MAYPVVFDVAHQEKYNRAHVGLRVAILIVLAILGAALGWVHAALWLAIPVAAAVMISQKGAERYLAESGDNMTKWLRYIVGFYAYMILLTDRLPVEDAAASPARFEVTPGGAPSIGQALLRIIFVIPHAIVLAILGIVAGILLLIAAVMVLVQESYPEGIHGFLRGYLRWHARVFGYLGSLVEGYPPFAFDTGHEGALPPAPEAPQPGAAAP